ncbi:Bax inhibitor-1/YccA family protein [Halotalea alkalilenta]|uniref:Bax inhibitor-1/YccA family protein n=1 Tax=Halotalea alkalilenta TaxID=376489 RepID=UPI0005BE5B26|nr:Bax inhibitor-1/YccA family protein [Halotalea alkalilenta]
MENRSYGIGQRTGERSIIAHKVLRNTYMLLAMTLLFSAVTAAAAVGLGVQRMNILLFLVGAYGLMFLVHRTANSAAGLLSTFAFTGFMGFSLGPILSAYLSMSGGPQLVMTALGMTGAAFVGLSAVVLVTRKDFGFLANFIFVGMIVLLLSMLGAWLFQLPGMMLAISAGFVLLSSALILYETSQIIHGGQDNYILATISLYVAIYNLFLSLLSLLGMGGGSDD